MKNGGLTEELVEEKLRELRGNLAEVGRHFGVTRQAVHQFVKSRPDLVAVADDCRESMKDTAENSLYKAVEAGEAWAVCFYLKTQARDRGYIEKQEHEHSGSVSVPLLTRVVVVHHRVAAEERPAIRGGGADPGDAAGGGSPDQPAPGAGESVGV